jgi:hypothetical protein
MEWEAARKTKNERTLNDHVDSIHLTLVDHPKLGEEYNVCLDAVYDEDATEGSLSYDNFKAAAIIRAYAEDEGHNPYIANKKLATIVKALNVVLRRYGKTRQERARRVGGETVSNGE